MKNVYFFSLLMLLLCHSVPIWAQDDGARVVTQLQFGKQTVTVPADGELIFYDFKGTESINSVSTNNQHSLTVFEPEVEGMSVQITFENIDIKNDGSSYPGKVLVYSGDPDSGDAFAWASTYSDVTGSTLMPEGDVMATLDGTYSDLSYYSSAPDGSLGVGVLWRYAKRCDGWTAKVRCIKLTDMSVTGAGSAYAGVSDSPKSKVDVPVAGVYVDAEGVMNPDRLTGIDFKVPVNEGMIDPLSVKLYDGEAGKTPIDATVTANGDFYRISLDKPLALGRNVFTIAADILSSAEIGSRLMVSVVSVSTASIPGGVEPFVASDPVEIVNPALVNMAQGAQTIYVGSVPLSFYDDGGLDGNVTSKFSGTTTFLPSVEGKKVQIDFKKVLLANGYMYYQYLNVYNGAEAKPENLIMRVMNGETPLIHSTSADGALTVELGDNGTSQTNEGFEAEVSLFEPQPMTLESMAVTGVSDETMRAGATSQPFAIINLLTANTEPALKLNQLKVAVSGAPGLVANAWLATASASPRVLAQAKEVNGTITLDLDQPLALKENDNILMLLVDVSDKALNDQALSLSVASVNLSGTEHKGPDVTVSRTIHNKLTADAGVQDVTIFESWEVANKPSEYSYYGYDDISGDQVLILRPGPEGTRMRLTFSKLSLRFPSYYGTKPVFKVIDGAGTSGKVLFEATSSNQSEIIGQAFDSSDESGALTILFNTNGNTGTSTSNGFEATAVPYKQQKMAVKSAEVSQAATRDIYSGDIEEEILLLNISTEGALDPLSLDEITIDLKGCEDLVENVKLISSGANDQYVQPVTLMATAKAAPAVTLRPTEDSGLISEGANYYWIAFDMKDKVENDRKVDAKIISMKVGGKDVDVANADPEGERMAKYIYKFHGDDVVYVDEPLLFYDNGGPNAYYTREHSGAVIFKPLDPNKAIRMRFNSFDTGYNDELYVYNGSGTDVANQLIKLFGDKAEPRDLASSASDGALTAYFRTGSYGLLSDGWEIVVEAFAPAPLSLGEVGVSAVAPVQVYSGSEDNIMLHAAVVVNGERGDFKLTDLRFGLAGSQAANVRAAKAWTTGTESSFIGARQFGETVVPSEHDGILDFSGEYAFPHAGTYHIWLTYDVAGGLEAGTLVKAALESMTISGVNTPVAESAVASAAVRAGMHGEYIIGISDNADYKTFASAIRDLCANGVDGPVDMLVEDGDYEESFSLQRIPGASNLNRVTFRSQSGNRAKVVISYGEEEKTLSTGVINFNDGASYITLKGLTVTTPAYKCDGIISLQGGCYYDTVDDCVIIGHAAATYEERVNLVYTFYLEQADKNCNYFTLSNSLLQGGYYGLSATGITNLNYPMMIHDVTVTGNTFVNQSSKALQAMGVSDGLVIRDNQFYNDGSVMTTSYHNIDLYRCTGKVIVADNLIDINAGLMSNYGTLTGESSADAIYLRDISSAKPSEKLIYNNDIRLHGAEDTNHTLHGIFVYDNDASIQSAQIVYNTIVVSGAANPYSSAFMMSDPMTGSSIINNIMQNKAGGPLLRGTAKAKLSELTISDNALFTTGQVWAMTPSDCPTFESAAAAIGQPVGIAEEAAFLADDMHELRAAGRLVSAKPVGYVTSDLLGNPRHESAPTIGAYEFKDQSGKPMWTDGYPSVTGITTNSASLNLCSDKASAVSYIVRESSLTPPAESEFEGARSASLHTGKPVAVMLADLAEETDYTVYLKLTSYIGVDAGEVRDIPFRTLSSAPSYSNPVAVITTKDVTSGHEGERMTLSGNGSGGMEPLTYKWTDQQGNLLGASESVDIDLTHSMTYRFTVTDNRGKEAFDEISINVTGSQYVATFEDLALSEESYWGGNDTNAPFFSGSFAFDYYHDSYGGSDFWGNFSYANLTSTDYNDYADQYKSAVGEGACGSKTFGVAYVNSYVGATYITVTNKAGGDKVDGLWLANTAWVMDCIENGDGLSTVPGGFGKDDYYKVRISGLKNASVVGSVEFYLADYRAEREQDRYALDSWQWVDLSSLGEVDKLWFQVESSKKNDFGITTPTYFCIDNVGDACPWEDVEEQVVAIVDGANGRLDLNELFGLNPALASVEYSIESPDGVVILDGDNAGIAEIVAPDGDDADDTFVLMAKATQQGRSSYLRIPVRLDFTSGVADAMAEVVKVYPVPAHDVLNISTGLVGYSIGLYDAQGRIVMSRDNLEGHSALLLPEVSAGVYVLRISHDAGTITRRIIIK